MKQSVIYKVETSYLGGIPGIRSSLPVVSYFSNLKITVERILATLAVRGWEEHRVNYTAVYRSLKERDKYVTEISLREVKIFRMEITKVLLNPALNDLGIDQRPG